MISGIRRRLAVLVAVTVGLGALAGLAGAAPIVYSTTPVAGWSTNGIVRTVLIVGDTAYAGGDFTAVHGPGGTPSVARAHLAAWDVHTGALRTGFAADTNGRVESLASDGTKLFVGGDFTTIKGVSKSRLAALDPASGNVISGWTANASSHVYALRTSGSRLYVGGAFGSLAGATPGPDGRGLDEHGCHRQRVRPDVQRRGARHRDVTRRQHRVRRGRLQRRRRGGAQLRGGAQRVHRRAPPAHVPVPVLREQPPRHGRPRHLARREPPLRRAHGQREPGRGVEHHHRPGAVVLPGRRRRAGRALLRRQRLLRVPRGRDRRPHGAPARRRRDHRRPRELVPAADRQLLRHLGDRRQRVGPPARRRVHEHQQRRHPGRRDPPATVVRRGAAGRARDADRDGHPGHDGVAQLGSGHRQRLGRRLPRPPERRARRLPQRRRASPTPVSRPTPT